MDTIIDLLGNSVVLLICFTLMVLTLAIAFIVWFSGFSAERQYILMEIQRSGPEGRKYWKIRLKKLYLSQIPVLGPFLCNRLK